MCHCGEQVGDEFACNLGGEAALHDGAEHELRQGFYVFASAFNQRCGRVGAGQQCFGQGVDCVGGDGFGQAIACLPELGAKHVEDYICVIST